MRKEGDYARLTAPPTEDDPAHYHHIPKWLVQVGEVAGAPSPLGVANQIFTQIF